MEFLKIIRPVSSLYFVLKYFIFVSNPFWLASYSFLFLNLHQVSVSVKTVYTYLRGNIISYHTYSVNEFLLQYTYFLSPLISFYIYYSSSSSFNPVFLLDIFGQVCLSFTSYSYHSAIYGKLKNISGEKVDILDIDIYKFYIADIIAIQIRGFLCIFYTSVFLLSSVALFQLITIYYFYDWILDMKYRGKALVYDEKPPFAFLRDLPLVACLSIIICTTNNRIAMEHVIISSMLIINLYLVRPFYELNHFVLHVILLYQTYAISLANASIF